LRELLVDTTAPVELGEVFASSSTSSSPLAQRR
jgi:hypothetical protein